MQLTHELFERIVGTAAPSGNARAETAAGEPKSAGALIMPAGARVVERRQVRRLRFGERAKVCLEREQSIGIWDTIMLQDISVAGVSFLSDRWLDVNDSLLLTLKDRAGQTVRFRCTIRRCERGGMGNVAFTVGSTFEQLLFDAVATAVDHQVEAADTLCSETAAVGIDSGKRPSTQRMGMLGRLKPSRLLSSLTRNDDYSTCRIGRFAGR